MGCSLPRLSARRMITIELALTRTRVERVIYDLSQGDLYDHWKGTGGTQMTLELSQLIQRVGQNSMLPARRGEMHVCMFSHSVSVLLRTRRVSSEIIQGRSESPQGVGASGIEDISTCAAFINVCDCFYSSVFFSQNLLWHSDLNLSCHFPFMYLYHSCRVLFFSI